MDKIAVIGLGYVGLPLAYEFGKVMPTVGFDINIDRINKLKVGLDDTGEVEDFDQAFYLKLTIDSELLADCNIYIITVPTPVDLNKQPDISFLEKASATVGKYLSKGNIVIYESTVYPGCTEEDCVPVLEKISGLIFNKDFFCGYSPERINPGDKKHPLASIKKITSGSTPEIAKKIDELYQKIITAGTHLASSIKVAEAAKVIENAQRDVNIAFINEMAILFGKLGVDTTEVLDAASSKWNFLRFQPGLVGGHCIGVDPYYLTQKAQKAGFFPEITLAARRLNDQMSAHIASRVIKLMVKKQIHPSDSKILILGVTFKENCPDLRNTKVVDIVWELNEYGANVELYDPWVKSSALEKEYNLSTIEKIQSDYDAVILTVGHRQFKEINLKLILKENSVVFDVKNFLPLDWVDERL